MGKDCYDIDIALDNMLGSEFVDKVRDYLLSTGEQVQGVAVIPWYAFFFFANVDPHYLIHGSDMYFAIAHNFISMSFCIFFFLNLVLSNDCGLYANNFDFPAILNSPSI